MRREHRAHGHSPHCIAEWPMCVASVVVSTGDGSIQTEESRKLVRHERTQMSTVTEHTQMAHLQIQNGPPQAPPAEAARRSRRPQGRPRVLTHPQDVMALVLRQIENGYIAQITNAINAIALRAKKGRRNA